MSKSKLPPIVDKWLLMPGHVLSQHIKDGTVSNNLPVSHDGVGSDYFQNLTSVNQQLTSVKLCELYIERIKQVNPHVNAMVEDRFKEALAEAQQIDQLLASQRAGKPESEFSDGEQDMLRSPLLGVPISVKESIKVKGMKNSCGLWRRRNVCASFSSVVVKNAFRFGMVPICTTNVPECTMHWADCENKVYGRTNNPYDHSRVPGASSGGEGSLLGAGGSVIGIGSDAGGSLRLPAHYCGIFSHKPSHFLVSLEGNYPEWPKSWMGMSTFGPMCRYASDLRPLFKCLMSDKNNPRRDTYVDWQPAGIGELRQLVLQRLDEQVGLSKIKIYYFNFNESSKLVGNQSIHVQEEIMEAQKEVVEHFRTKFGCQVEEINLDKYMKDTMLAWVCMLCQGGENDDSDFSSLVEHLMAALKVDNVYLELCKSFLGLSKHMRTSLLVAAFNPIPDDETKAIKLVNEYRTFFAKAKAEIEAILGESGVLITPTLPTVSYKYGETLFKREDPRFTALYNCLKLPVSHATLRLDEKNKLPYGFSIAAKQYHDHLTLAFAEEIGSAFGGWRQPTVSPEAGLQDNNENKQLLDNNNGKTR